MNLVTMVLTLRHYFNLGIIFCAGWCSWLIQKVVALSGKVHEPPNRSGEPSLDV